MAGGCRGEKWEPEQGSDTGAGQARTGTEVGLQTHQAEGGDETQDQQISGGEGGKRDMSNMVTTQAHTQSNLVIIFINEGCAGELFPRGQPTTRGQVRQC